MVRADQERLTRRGLEFAIVPEDESGAAPDDSAGLQHVQVCVEGDLPERNYYPYVGQKIELPLEKRAAVAQLLRGRLVAGRSATRGGRDVCVAQGHAVSARDALGLRGETRLV